MAFVAPNDPVGKGPVTVCLDRMSTSSQARSSLERLQLAIIALGPDNFRGLERVFAEHLFPGFYTPDQITRITAYLKQYWFDEETGWWPTFQPIAPIYAVGLIQTINASLARKGDPLPIDSYWILNHNHVEMINLASARQVTLLIATPPPPELGPSGIGGEESQVWVTSRRAGRTPGEINFTGMAVSGGTDLRVRTFKIETRTAGKRP
jgi:hypothetical protein